MLLQNAVFLIVIGILESFIVYILDRKKCLLLQKFPKLFSFCHKKKRFQDTEDQLFHIILLIKAQLQSFDKSFKNE